MSDVMPKIKLYVFISVMSLLINIGILLSYIASNTTGYSFSDIVVGGSSVLTAFIPFVSLINFALLGIPTEIFIFAVIMTGIFSTIQALILVFILMQVAKNLLWQPDV